MGTCYSSPYSGRYYGRVRYDDCCYDCPECGCCGRDSDDSCCYCCVACDRGCDCYPYSYWRGPVPYANPVGPIITQQPLPIAPLVPVAPALIPPYPPTAVPYPVPIPVPTPVRAPSIPFPPPAPYPNYPSQPYTLGPPAGELPAPLPRTASSGLSPRNSPRDSGVHRPLRPVDRARATRTLTPHAKTRLVIIPLPIPQKRTNLDQLTRLPEGRLTKVSPDVPLPSLPPDRIAMATNTGASTAQAHTPHTRPDQVDTAHTRLNPDRSPSSHRPKHKPSKSRVQIQSPRAERRMSPTETIYPDPQAAHAAFEDERANNPLHRRVPTPYSRRRSVSSIRSDHSAPSARTDGGSVDSERTLGGAAATDAIIGPDEPHFGSSRGIGPPRDAIQVIGLGRKEPRHRKYDSHLLKPAIRGAAGSGSSQISPDSGRRQDKPLPSRPSSFIVPTGDHSPSGPEFRYISQRSPERPSLIPRSQSRSHVRSGSQLGGLRSLLSSLSLDPALPLTAGGAAQGARPPFARRSTPRAESIIVPADDLFTYLRVVELPSWSAWSSDKESKRYTASLGSLINPVRSKGFDQMPWAWHRRMEAAEAARSSGRALVSWEATGRHWEKKILEWLDDNVPIEPIEPANRWGSQIFALPAHGFDTLEFFDEAAEISDDLGLLSWLTGSVLQTAVSALHMLRYSSQSFTFHLVPSSSPTPCASPAHALWDGIGTLALVNKADQLDRAMIVEVRPPSVCDGGVMREFAKSGRLEGWWHLPAQYCVGETGQANLLQAQVYDACVQNQVYFFAVTNTKHWVFGHFNSNYTKCWVGHVVERKQRDPNVMQCLVAWTVRAVDERPRRSDVGTGLSRGHSRSHSRQADGDIHHDRTLSQQQHGAHSPQPQPQRPYAQHGHDGVPLYAPSSPVYPTSPSSPHPMQMHSMPMGDFGQVYGVPPSYYDLHPQMGSPPPFAAGGMGYGSWDGRMGQHDFSPVPGYGGASWYSGFGWSSLR